MTGAVARTATAPRRPAPKFPRHELPYVRPSDLAALLNVGATTAWRLRQLPSFPPMNALGRYCAADVLAFVASLAGNPLREAREAIAQRRAGERNPR